MKSLILLSILLSASAFGQNSCRYQLIEQNGRFYVIQQRIGELPSENEVIKTSLESRGIKDIEIANKPKDDKQSSNNEIKEARIKVRFDSDKREEAEAFLQRRCN